MNRSWTNITVAMYIFDKSLHLAITPPEKQRKLVRYHDQVARTRIIALFVKRAPRGCAIFGSLDLNLSSLMTKLNKRDELAFATGFS